MGLKLEIQIFASKLAGSPMVWIAVPQHCGLFGATTLLISKNDRKIIALNGFDELSIVFEPLDQKCFDALHAMDKKIISVGEISPTTKRLVNAYCLDVVSDN